MPASLECFAPSLKTKVRRYKSVVLYGRETCLLPLREEHRPKVFLNMMLRRVFGLKMYEMTGQRNRYSEELHNLYALPYIIRMIKSDMDMTCSMHGEG
jgi:hypothetical protein